MAGEREANALARKTVYNKSGSCSTIFLSFAPQVTYEHFGIRLQRIRGSPCSKFLNCHIT